jgi:hypothetical protein
MVREIRLSAGRKTLVDDFLFDRLSVFLWQSKGSGTSRDAVYAARSDRSTDKHNKTVLMHREIWEMVNGAIPVGMEIDHINRDKLDNRLENLRVCTRSQNTMNRIKLESKSSRFKGVVFRPSRGKYEAKIRKNGEEIYLGIFKSEIDAAQAYDAKAVELFGEFAKLNFEEAA